MHIAKVAQEAIEAAQTEDVFFNFNGVLVTVTKGQSVDDVVAEWERLMELKAKEYVDSGQAAKDQAKREKEARQKRKQYAEMVKALPTMDEAALRDLDEPRPHTIEELNDLITALTSRQHDYGTCVYAMSLSAVATFNLVAHILGVTGFQASCADLDIIKRIRSLEGPFAIIDASKMLYPQYDIQNQVREYLTQWRPWAAEQATKLLKESQYASPTVIGHWHALAEQE